ncbi:MAG: Rrf2 family transcriptional regulator [Planctomycetes bacterium]|nr:Rrf2 family transcriptional regulator [Planctomycetota bacterium]
MLTKTSEYALHALVYLAQNQHEWPVPVHEIAKKTGIPPRYLSKVLRDLTRVGILNSTRGKLGGFEPARPLDEISLLETVSLFEPLEQKRCPFGKPECSDENPCQLHEQWSSLLQERKQLLIASSLKTLVDGAENGKAGQ